MSSLRLLVSVVVEPDDGGFHAYCPAFEGLHIDGQTEQEALDRTKKALSVYVESMRANKEPLPIGPYCIVEEEETAVHHVPPDAVLRPVELELA